LGELSFEEGITKLPDYLFMQTGITEITIPESVIEIGIQTFSFCENLETVNLPSNLKVLDVSVFSGCSKLNKVNIPKSLTNTFSNIFSGCPLGELTFEEGMTKLPNSLFVNSLIEKIKIPNGITEIGRFAFAGCTSLQSVELPNTLSIIHDYAFDKCTSLSGNVKLHKKLVTIGYAAFRDCSSIQSVEILNKYAGIGNQAFEGHDEELVIKGYDESTAQAYAEKNNITFESFGKSNDLPFELKGISLEDDTIIGPQITMGDFTFSLFKLDAGGMIPLKNENVEFTFDPYGGIYQATIGLKEFGEEELDRFDTDSYNEIKKAFNEIKNNSKDKTAFNSLKEKLTDNTVVEIGPEFEGSLAGYLELKISSNGKYNNIKGGIILAVSAGLDFPEMRFPGMPIAYVAFGISGSVEGGLNLKYVETILNDEIIREVGIDGNLAIQVVPSVSLGAGDGEGKIINVEAGLEGIIGLDMMFDVTNQAPLEKALEAYLSAALTAEASALGFQFIDYRHEFERFQIYPENQLKPQSLSVLTVDNQQYPLVGREYQMQSLGGEMRPDTVSILSQESQEEYSVIESLHYENIYPHNRARLIALENGKAILIWLGDTGEKSAVNRTSVLYSVFDGTNWGQIQELSDGGTLNESLSATYFEGKMYLTWIRGNNPLTEEATFEEAAVSVDIYYSIFENGSFSKPEKISKQENTVYEMAPSLAVGADKMVSAWVENSMNDPLLSKGKNKICYTLSDLGEFGDIQIVQETEDAILSVKAVVVDESPVIIYTIRENDHTQIKVYKNGKTTTLNGGVYAVYDGKIFYGKEERIFAYDIAEETEQAYSLPAFANFRVVGNGSKTYLLSEVKEGIYSKLYCYELDVKQGVVKGGARVFAESTYLSDFSAAVLSNGKLYSAISEYAVVEGEAGTTFDSSKGNLRVMTLSDFKDLEVTEIGWADVSRAGAGDSFYLHVNVTNHSMNNASGLKAVIKQQDEILQTVELEDEIATGSNVDIAIPFTCPDNFNETSLTVTMEVEGDQNISNNSAEIQFGGADLLVGDFSVTESETHMVLSAKLENQGNEAAENVMVSVSANDVVFDGVSEETAAQIRNYTYENLAAGEEKEITLQIPIEEWHRMSGDIIFYFDVESDTLEYDYGNNSENLVIGGDILYSVTLSHQNTGMYLDETLQLQAFITPFNAPQVTVSYESSNEEIATVDSTGLVTPKAEGEVIITVKAVDANGTEETADCRIVIEKRLPNTIEEDPGYPIIYVLEGGSNDTRNPEKYVTQEEEILLYAPTKEGYTFAGWFKDHNFKEQIRAIPSMSSESFTLYAKWVALEKERGGELTSIAVELVEGYSHTYTGSAIKPQVRVYDDHLLLTEGKDYKVSYKNNTKAFIYSEDMTASVKKKAPQVIVTGLGQYKGTQPVIHYFTIERQDLGEAAVTYKDSVEVKAKDGLQKATVTLTFNGKKLASNTYKLSYYRGYDSVTGNLSEEQKGLTSVGTYYVLVEAAKDAKGNYSGNFCGSQLLTIQVVPKGESLAAAKISYNKTVEGTSKILTEEQLVEKIIKNLKIGGKTYQTTAEEISVFLRNFVVESTTVTKEGETVPLEQLLSSAGTKTIRIVSKEGAEISYAGSQSITFIVKGKALNKSMFHFSYEAPEQKAVTKAAYTGEVRIPQLTVKSGNLLEPGKDYKVSYLQKKNPVNAADIINAGSYTAVIEGQGLYTGKVQFNFTITPVKLTDAYKQGQLSIEAPIQPAIQNPAGAKADYLFTFDSDGTSGSNKAQKLTEGADYTITYSDNKAVTTEKKKRKATLKGTGNYTGTLNAKTAQELQFEIVPKALDSDDISVVVKSITK
ncbi:MAG: leucine-rich repeat protein, partial [Lachnospiraceae bacterium]|nr:leucine-rich repeat protein [Lachnospiraceae bacterium]